MFAAFGTTDAGDPEGVSGSGVPCSAARREFRVPQVISLLLFFALGWFALIRPQRQRVARHLALVQSLAIGDQVITSGGILGVVRSLGDDTFELEIADGVVVNVAKAAVHDRKASASDRPGGPGVVGPDPEDGGEPGAEQR